MRVLVCGGRDFKDRALLVWVFDNALKGIVRPVIVSGAARGADLLADLEARKRGWWSWTCPADWDNEGKAAGPLRNQRMLDEAMPDIVLAFPTKNSVGTWDMVERAKKAGLTVVVTE